MKKEHKNPLKLGNHIRNMVGQPYYKKKPSDKVILEEIIKAMAKFNGTAWSPVNKVIQGKPVEWSLMLNQCPGTCGYVWKLDMENESAVSWLVNEINQRRHGINS